MYSLLLLLLAAFVRLGIVRGHGIDGLTAEIVGNASARLFFPVARLAQLICPGPDDLVGLSRALSERSIAATYLNPQSFEEDARRFSDHQTIFLVDYDCPWAQRILKKANELRMFRGPFKWLILQDQRDDSVSCAEDCLRKTFGDFAMYPDSDVVLLRRTSDERFEINALYRPSPVRGMVVEKRGYWSSSDGIRLTDDYVPSKRRKDLQGTPLKSSIVVTNPDTLNHLTDYHDKHVDTITKCNYAWLHHLVDAMNATVSHGVVSSWGYRDKNGSWNGLMGELSRGEIDIGGTSMFLTADRWDYVDFLPLSTSTELGFIYRQPPLSFVSNLFTLPFQSSVWLALGLLLLLIIALLAASARWEWIARGSDGPPLTLSDSLLLVLGAAAQQGFGFHPSSLPTRIVLLMLLMTALSLYAAYSANIVALLQSTSKSINTLKDLLDSPIKCGAQEIVYIRHYFKLEDDPIRRAIIDQKIDPKNAKSNFMTAEDGIQRVRQGFFAFFMETGPGYKIIQETFEEDEKCGFREMYFIIHSYPFFSVVKHSPYLEILKFTALKISESGLRARQMLRLYTKRPPCNGRSKFVSVGLKECYFAFYIMGYGMLTAFFVLIIEVVWTKSCTKPREDSDRNQFGENVE